MPTNTRAGAKALLGLFGAFLACGSASAASQSEVLCRGDGSRVALLIGNQDYSGSMQALTNPRRDIASFGKILCDNSFTVFRHSDLDLRAFELAVDTFVSAARMARTSLVYYSGHGFALGRRNWLVPVDAKLSCDDMLGDEAAARRAGRRLIDLDEDVMSRLSGFGDQIIILDACRTDPIKGCRGGAAPTLVKGFNRASGASGRLTVYATQDGQVALDAIPGSDLSPLMTAMAAHLPQNPKLNWLMAMSGVSDEVFRLTNNRQRPNIDISISPRGCLAQSCEPDLKLPPPNEVPRLTADEIAWDYLKTTSDVSALRRFVEDFPGSRHSPDAQARILSFQRQGGLPPVSRPNEPCGATTVAALSPSRAPQPLSSPEECTLRPAMVFAECEGCPEMVVVPAGSFEMGSPEGEPGREANEGPRHRVTIGRPFAAGAFAVTFDDWDACVRGGGCNGYMPKDSGWGRGRRPVINVSWHDAQAYATWLSQETGKQYRLLSEAEREYVARATTGTAFWWGTSISSAQANYGSIPGDNKEFENRRKTLPVATFSPNPWGFYQVNGNVFEWTEDCWNDSYVGAPLNGAPWLGGQCNRRTLRGGSWNSRVNSLRAAARHSYDANYRSFSIGFRVARTLSK